MAVIFAVVGGGAVLGIATSPDYGDYGDHSDHIDYSNYSDEAERRQRRIEDKKREINSKKSNVNTYKTQSVNSYLQSSTLREESGVTVNLAEVRRDGDKKISDKLNTDFNSDATSLKHEIEEIDAVINKIDKILKEGE